MSTRYAQFDLASLPPAYAVEGRGLVLVNTVGGGPMSSFARGDVLVDATEPRAFEVVFDTTDATLIAAVGVCQAGANLGQSLGFAADTLGWRLDAGQVISGSLLLSGGLPAVPRRRAVTVMLLPITGGAQLILFDQQTQRFASGIISGSAWHLAVALSGLQPGATRAYLNSGQSNFAGPGTSTRGWSMPRTQLAPQRIADRDLLTRVSDAPANTRYEGVVADDGVVWSSDLDFWPMPGASDAPSRTFARVVIADREQRVPALASAAVIGSPVRIRLLAPEAALASANEWFNGIVEQVHVDGDGDISLDLRDPHPELDEPLLRNRLLPFQTQADLARPQPLVIGAVASAPCIPVNSDGTSQWIADAPVEIAFLRESGDLLTMPADFTRDAARQQVRLSSPPVGPLTADVSSFGLRTGGSGDLWAARGMPFTGIDQGAPTGISRTGTAGLPVFRTTALANPHIGGAGKPSHSSGVVFPNAQRGALASITAGATLAAGAAARFRIVAQASAALPLWIASSPHAAAVMAMINTAGFSEGIITNASGVAATVCLVSRANGSGGDGPIVSSFEVFPLDGHGDPQPATLERAMREVFTRTGTGLWHPDDAWAIDGATGYAGVGLYADDPGFTARSAAQLILDSYGAAACVGRRGMFRVSRLIDPSAVAPAITIDDGDIAQLRVVNDTAPGLTTSMGFRPNAKLLSESELVTDMVELPMPVRRELQSIYRGVVHAGPKLATPYTDAERRPPAHSLFWDRADAQREIDRICALYTSERRFVFVDIEGRPDLQFEPGLVVEVHHPEQDLLRKRMLVLGARIESVSGNIQLRLWG